MATDVVHALWNMVRSRSGAETACPPCAVACIFVLDPHIDISSMAEISLQTTRTKKQKATHHGDSNIDSCCAQVRMWPPPQRQQTGQICHLQCCHWALWQRCMSSVPSCTRKVGTCHVAAQRQCTLPMSVSKASQERAASLLRLHRLHYSPGMAAHEDAGSCSAAACITGINTAACCSQGRHTAR